MAARNGVVTGGTWCCDHNKLVDHWPAEDGIAEIASEERSGGGSACNMATDLKRLDPAFFVETIGILGDDEDGRLLLAQADAHGIERAQLQVIPGTLTNYTDCFSSRASGRRTHLFFRGSNALLTPDVFDFTRTRARLLHLGLPGIHATMDSPWADEPNGWVAVLRKARSAGLETNMELASIAPETIARLVRPCLPLLDLLVVNDFEIGAIAGMATSADGQTDVGACREAARAVMAAGSMAVLVVHFPQGAIALKRSGDFLAKPSVRAPDEEIVGANGAGDAFAAGVVYALHEGRSMEDAMALGHAAAAASLRGVTTTGTVVSRRECLELATRWGWRDEVA
jgi:sugar/nucleoside kinase (ribokinase family)